MLEWLIRAEPCLQPRRVAGTVPSAPAIGRSRFEASRQRVLSGYRPVRHGDLSASGDTELLAQNVRMSLRCSRRNAEALAHFVVRATGGDELYDLPLPLRDGRKRVSQCVVHGKRSYSARRRLTIDRKAYFEELHPWLDRGTVDKA